MKIAYWGHFYPVINSKYTENIIYFVFEENKCPPRLLEYVKARNVKYHMISSRAEMLEIIESGPLVDLTVVGSFGRIFSSEMINKLNRKIINIHPGILPDYRGRHPLPQAILNREKEMGLVSHVLNEGIDAGKVIIQETARIDYKKSYKYNEDRLFNLCPTVLDKTVEKYLNGEINFHKAVENGGIYYKPLDKDSLQRITGCEVLEEL